MSHVEYFKVDPVECFAPAWQTAGFTTVSSIESADEGEEWDNREEVSGCVPAVVARFYECYVRRA